MLTNALSETTVCGSLPLLPVRMRFFFYCVLVFSCQLASTIDLELLLVMHSSTPSSGTLTKVWQVLNNLETDMEYISHRETWIYNGIS